MEIQKLTKCVSRNTCHGQTIHHVRPMVPECVTQGNVSQNISQNQSFMVIGRAGQDGQPAHFRVDVVSGSVNDFVIIQLHKMEENFVSDLTQVMNCAILTHAML